eukprot:jgi/Botrbrau1/4846/Bobra.0032s0007.1
MNSVYHDSTLAPASTVLTYVSRSFDYYSRGPSLSEQDITAVVDHAVGSGALPKDPQGIYFVVGSKDVDQDGFCRRYCGWHGHDVIQGVPLTYGFVGGHHKVSAAVPEAVTDPTLTGWFDSAGLENGDKCAWKFGSVGISPNGGRFNMWVNGRYYLIQENWVNQRGGYCAMTLKTPPGVVPCMRGPYGHCLQTEACLGFCRICQVGIKKPLIMRSGPGWPLATPAMSGVSILAAGRAVCYAGERDVGP